MRKLTPEQIGAYFTTHLPYRIGILVVHHRMTRQSWTGDRAQLEAAFEASLITGRMFLNVLGVGKVQDSIARFSPRKDDVIATDLGGTCIDINSLKEGDVRLLKGFLTMADKGAAHLTMPMEHPWERTHEASEWIYQRVKLHLYTQTGRLLEDLTPCSASNQSEVDVHSPSAPL